ncbi:MAG: PutP [Deltaproteobacteria bacterium]|nr:MAG: PutP [Deltaproteobacteria bacterium]
MGIYIYRVTFLLTFICISGLAIRRSAHVKSVDDFSVASRSLSGRGVSWIIIGTLVGGVSTIGTVQMAYTHGISAGIFTFGSSLSCFLLGCFFARPLREEKVITVSEYLGRYFGQRFRYYCSTVNSAGMFIHVVAQFLAAIAILQSIFHCNDGLSVLLTMILIGIFVITGGVTGAGLIGKVKFFMLYFIMFISAATALYKTGGMETIIAMLPRELDMLGFTRYGKSAAIVDLVSMLIGVLSTQIYLQAIFSAKDVREARNGAFLSATLIPPIGLLGIIIGLYLRGQYPELPVSPAQALPFYLEQTFPPALAAFFSAGILLTVLGTGAGLTLGVTTNIYNDFLSGKKILRRLTVPPITVVRLSTLVVLAVAALLVFSGLDSAILRWSYMSMGMRGCAVFAGLFILVFFKQLASSRLVLLLLYLLPITYILINVR